MPNIKSAKKRVKTSREHRSVNMARRSILKTFLKKAVSSINSNDATTAAVDVKNALRALDIAVSKGTIHKNQAARRKSRLMKKINALAK